MNFNFQSMGNTALAVLTTVGLQILGAIALFIIGRIIINFCIKLVNHGLKRQNIDPTINGYLTSTLHVLLNIILRRSTGGGCLCHRYRLEWPAG